MPVVITVLNSYSVIKISCNSLYIRSGQASRHHSSKQLLCDKDFM